MYICIKFFYLHVPQSIYSCRDRNCWSKKWDYVTLPKTNIAPKKWWFPIGFSFSRGSFSGAMLVSGRVTAGEDGVELDPFLVTNWRWPQQIWWRNCIPGEIWRNQWRYQYQIISKAQSNTQTTGNTYLVQLKHEIICNRKAIGLETYHGYFIAKRNEKDKQVLSHCICVIWIHLDSFSSWQWDIQRLWRLQCVHARTNS